MNFCIEHCEIIMALDSIFEESDQKTNERFDCPICRKRFWLKPKFDDHVASHQLRSLSCNICNKSFSDQKHLDEHYLTHTDVIKTYDCNECPRKFLKSYQLEQHMQFHTRPVNAKFSPTKKSKHFNKDFHRKGVAGIINTSASEEFTETDSDFSDADDYILANKIVKTRSGRLVKRKKPFDEEMDVDHKYLVKEEARFKKPRISECYIQKNEPIKILDVKSLCENIVDKEVSVVEEACVEKPIISECNDQQNETLKISDVKTLYEDIVEKEISIVVEKIPEHMYEEYVIENNDLTENHLNSDEISLLSNASSITCNTENYSHENKPKLSDLENIQQIAKDKLQSCAGKPEDVSPSVPIDSVADKQSEIAASINFPTNEIVIADIVTTPSYPKLVKNCKFSQENSKVPVGRVKPLCKEITEKPKTSVSSVHTIYTPPRHVDKQYLYVGSNADINKIKKVVEEANASTMPNHETSVANIAINKIFGTTGVTLHKIGNSAQRSCNASPTSFNAVSVKHCNLGSKDSLPRNAAHSLNSSNSQNVNKFKKSPPNEEGILDKKVVENYVVCRVTPEYMQKIRNPLEFSKTLSVKSSAKKIPEIASDSCKTSNQNKILTASATNQEAKRECLGSNAVVDTSFKVSKISNLTNASHSKSVEASFVHSPNSLEHSKNSSMQGQSFRNQGITQIASANTSNVVSNVTSKNLTIHCKKQEMSDNHTSTPVANASYEINTNNVRKIYQNNPVQAVIVLPANYIQKISPQDKKLPTKETTKTTALEATILNKTLTVPLGRQENQRSNTINNTSFEVNKNNTAAYQSRSVKDPLDHNKIYEKTQSTIDIMDPHRKKITYTIHNCYAESEKEKNKINKGPNIHSFNSLERPKISTQSPKSSSKGIIQNESANVSHMASNINANVTVSAKEQGITDNCRSTAIANSSFEVNKINIKKADQSSLFLQPCNFSTLQHSKVSLQNQKLPTQEMADITAANASPAVSIVNKNLTVTTERHENKKENQRSNAVPNTSFEDNKSNVTAYQSRSFVASIDHNITSESTQSAANKLQLQGNSLTHKVYNCNPGFGIEMNKINDVPKICQNNLVEASIVHSSNSLDHSKISSTPRAKSLNKGLVQIASANVTQARNITVKEYNCNTESEKECQKKLDGLLKSHEGKSSDSFYNKNLTIDKKNYDKQILLQTNQSLIVPSSEKEMIEDVKKPTADVHISFESNKTDTIETYQNNLIEEVPENWITIDVIETLEVDENNVNVYQIGSDEETYEVIESIEVNESDDWNECQVEPYEETCGTIDVIETLEVNKNVDLNACQVESYEETCRTIDVVETLEVNENGNSNVCQLESDEEAGITIDAVRTLRVNESDNSNACQLESDEETCRIVDIIETLEVNESDNFNSCLLESGKGTQNENIQVLPQSGLNDILAVNIVEKPVDCYRMVSEEKERLNDSLKSLENKCKENLNDQASALYKIDRRQIPTENRLLLLCAAAKEIGNTKQSKRLCESANVIKKDSMKHGENTEKISKNGRKHKNAEKNKKDISEPCEQNIAKPTYVVKTYEKNQRTPVSEVTYDTNNESNQDEPLVEIIDLTRAKDINEKLYQKYKAKLAEKERKKKQKFEYKKKVKYIEKIINSKPRDIYRRNLDKGILPSGISIKDMIKITKKCIKETTGQTDERACKIKSYLQACKQAKKSSKKFLASKKCIKKYSGTSQNRFTKHKRACKLNSVSQASEQVKKSSAKLLTSKKTKNKDKYSDTLISKVTPHKRACKLKSFSQAREQAKKSSTKLLISKEFNHKDMFSDTPLHEQTHKLKSLKQSPKQGKKSNTNFSLQSQSNLKDCSNPFAGINTDLEEQEILYKRILDMKVSVVLEKLPDGMLTFEKPISIKQLHFVEKDESQSVEKAHSVKKRGRPKLVGKVCSMEKNEPQSVEKAHSVNKRGWPKSVEKVHTMETNEPKSIEKVCSMEKIEPKSVDKVHIMKKNEPQSVKKANFVKKRGQPKSIEKAFSMEKNELKSVAKVHTIKQNEPQSVEKANSVKKRGRPKSVDKIHIMGENEPKSVEKVYNMKKNEPRNIEKVHSVKNRGETKSVEETCSMEKNESKSVEKVHTMQKSERKSLEQVHSAKKNEPQSVQKAHEKKRGQTESVDKPCSVQENEPKNVEDIDSMKKRGRSKSIEKVHTMEKRERSKSVEKAFFKEKRGQSKSVEREFSMVKRRRSKTVEKAFFKEKKGQSKSVERDFSMVIKRRSKSVEKVHTMRKNEPKNIEKAHTMEKSEAKSVKAYSVEKNEPQNVEKVCTMEKNKPKRFEISHFVKKRGSAKSIEKACSMKKRGQPKKTKHVKTRSMGKNEAEKSGSTKRIDGAIENARSIGIKFNKNLNENEYLKLLEELEELIDTHNIGNKCQFLNPTIRFCRLYVDNYKVRQIAISLSTKIKDVNAS